MCGPESMLRTLLWCLKYLFFSLVVQEEKCSLHFSRQLVRLACFFVSLSASCRFPMCKSFQHPNGLVHSRDCNQKFRCTCEMGW